MPLESFSGTSGSGGKGLLNKSINAATLVNHSGIVFYNDRK
jgi:hypothetical protein